MQFDVLRVAKFERRHEIVRRLHQVVYAAFENADAAEYEERVVRIVWRPGIIDVEDVHAKASEKNAAGRGQQTSADCQCRPPNRTLT